MKMEYSNDNGQIDTPVPVIFVEILQRHVK